MQRLSHMRMKNTISKMTITMITVTIIRMSTSIPLQLPWTLMEDGSHHQAMAGFGSAMNRVLFHITQEVTGCTPLTAGHGRLIIVGVGHRFTMGDGLMTRSMDGCGFRVA